MRSVAIFCCVSTSDSRVACSIVLCVEVFGVFVCRTDTFSPFAKSFATNNRNTNTEKCARRVYVLDECASSNNSQSIHTTLLWLSLCVCVCVCDCIFSNNNNHWSNALRLLILIWVEVDILLDYGKALGSIVILYLLRLYYQWATV